MTCEIRVPQWGMGIKECRVVSWLKAEGDPIRKGEPIAELETAKATQELESPASGRLESIVVAEGEMVPVRTLLGTIRECEQDGA
ncbi:MAG: lipoyl domain-containing protein [Deltaproteobacteria bacterium]|nr:lipoyl domain-containing protein [Deltaproteobacteria bacterium]MBW2398560.1 lipoyl domain-containing protein [Deltaproteobacteria bacterium]MBW2665618.1 lipoyl domain-containing protein [Deltaproteobacteria bacterium]